MRLRNLLSLVMGMGVLVAGPVMGQAQEAVVPSAMEAPVPIAPAAPEAPPALVVIPAPGAPSQDPLFAPMPEGQAPAAAVAGTGVNQDDIPDNWKISIMFPVKDMRNLSQVLEAVRRRKLLGEEGVIVPEGLEGELGEIALPAVDLPKEAPAFYLNSILYRTPQQWAVWINGTKITPDAPMADITIQSVGEREVVFLWESKHLSAISPGWEESVKTQKQLRVEEGKKVYITLYPNQSFVSRAMQVIEGKGTTSSLTGESAAAETPAEAPKVEKPVKAPKPKKEKPVKAPTAPEKSTKEKSSKKKADMPSAKPTPSAPVTTP